MIMNGINTIEIKKDENGEYKNVQIGFGPHYFLKVYCGDRDTVTFELGVTHHGFKADASEVNGELERFINKIRKAYPKNMVG